MIKFCKSSGIPNNRPALKPKKIKPKAEGIIGLGYDVDEGLWWGILILISGAMIGLYYGVYVLLDYFKFY